MISTRKVKADAGTLYLELKCGNLFQQRVNRLQTDQAHEIARLIRQYMSLHRRKCDFFHADLHLKKKKKSQQVHSLELSL